MRRPAGRLRAAAAGGRGGGRGGAQGPLELKPEHENFSVYFNIDNGTGALRGIYTQGNDAVVPIFREWIEPFRSLGMTTVTTRNTSRHRSPVVRRRGAARASSSSRTRSSTTRSRTTRTWIRTSVCSRATTCRWRRSSPASPIWRQIAMTSCRASRCPLQARAAAGAEARLSASVGVSVGKRGIVADFQPVSVAKFAWPSMHAPEGPKDSSPGLAKRSPGLGIEIRWSPEGSDFGAADN